MRGILVDTSAWISYFAEKTRFETLLDEELRIGRVYLSPIVAAELMSAQLDSDQKKKLQNFLLDLPLCDTLIDHWIRVGELRSRILKRGISISTPDAHIAQCCIDLDVALLSEDKIFHKIAKFEPLNLIL